MTGPYVGTVALVGQALRRDRVLASVWALVLVGVSYASAAATSSLYPTAQDQVAAARAFNATPAVVALYGPILDVNSLGELAMTKMTVLYAVFVAALFVVLVRRHTRTEEETGRTELLAGTAVGRRAPLAAALLESGVVATAIGVLAALGNTLGGLPIAGSLAFGASWCGIGLVAAATSAVACQLSASARTCGAIAAGAVGFAFVLRAVGDTTVSWLSWLSPFGWSTQLRAYSDPRWWVLVLYGTAALLLGVCAAALEGRRDLGSGLISARGGPADAAAGLTGPVSIALRLHATTVLVWSLATATMGLVLGAIVPNVTDLLDSTSARDLITRLGGEGAIERSLLAAELSIVAVVITGFGIAAITHAAADESSGRTDLVLSTVSSRARSFVAALLIALGGTGWLLLVTGIAVSLGYGLVGGDLVAALADVVPAALAQVPAAWVVVALAAVAFGTRAAWTPFAWVLLTGFVTLGQVGELLELPAWTIGVSPYSHTPLMPAEGFDPVTELVLLALTAGLLGVAWWRYRSRDLG